ncbi:MAG: GAF domain-containing protein [Candidatus Zixiibacteriota bacterium]|nr:MAG: GAF domain-containing protein [candidate division Zixibacteria bacterium]
MKQPSSNTANEDTQPQATGEPGQEHESPTSDMFADLELTLDKVAQSNPRIKRADSADTGRITDLKALLEASVAVNSSLVLDDVLQVVMRKAVDLMQAERGLVMLLDKQGELQVRSAYNLCKEEMMEEDFRVSSSVTSEVARTGKSIYTSDALKDDRFSQHKSVLELHLRSIMCVPLVVKEKVVGVIYLDNSSQTKMFLKSDLYIFELYAQLVSDALHNAEIYESLLKLEQYNEAIISSSPVGIVVLDMAGRIATINSSALRAFDLDRENIHLLGDGSEPSVFLDILDQSQRPQWQKIISTAMVTGQEHSEPRLRHNTGYIEKALSVKIDPLAGLPGVGDGLMLTVEDITEKTTMEQYVILSEKLVAKGEMAASVAHELNNYLSIISNNAELMSLNVERKKFDKVRFNSKSIIEAIQKIKRFVDNLMEFSSPESEFISYDLKTVIDDVLFSLRIQPRFKIIDFSMDLPADLPDLEMDVGQIQQVLMNLLINAADALGDRAAAEESAGRDFQPHIGVRASYQSASEEITLEIEDNGIGISEDTRDKIFALHFSTKQGGHGLGLHNCKKIVELHGGTLAVASREYEGTTFTITIPRFQSTRETSD